MIVPPFQLSPPLLQFIHGALKMVIGDGCTGLPEHARATYTLVSSSPVVNPLVAPGLVPVDLVEWLKKKERKREEQMCKREEKEEANRYKKADKEEAKKKASSGERGSQVV